MKKLDQISVPKDQDKPAQPRSKRHKPFAFSDLQTKTKKYTMPLCHFDSYNLWILKPTHLNRGRGIHVFRDLDTLKRLIKQYSSGQEVETYLTRKTKAEEDGKMPPLFASGEEENEAQTVRKKAAAGNMKFNTFIIQKYIERPMLIHNRKFDIRVWVFLSPEHDLYFFPEGYLRTCATDYLIDLKNIDDAFVHLTNNAV
jgi:hypothetical protein